MILKKLSFLVFVCLSLHSCKKLKVDELGLLVPPTVTEDVNLPQIVINDLALHAETFGNPNHPMVVVLHGGPGGDYRSMLNFKELASDSLFVVFYDQRGSGLSERLDESEFNSVQYFIDELRAVVSYYQKSPSQKVILAGHSWGAMLAAAYINQFSNEVDGVIFAEPGGFTWEQTLSYTQRSMQMQLFSEHTNDVVYQDQFITGADHNVLDYKLALSTAANVSTGDPVPAPFWRYGAVANIASIEMAIDYPDQMDFTEHLGLFSKKSLFLYSELNTAYGLDHAVEVSAALSDVDLIEVEGCGHEIPYYGWTTIYPLIKTYINEIL